MRSERLGAWALALALALGSRAATGTKITIVNMNNPGEGFNDPTPAEPVGGNPGTTIGEQRLNAFKAAAAFWEAKLSSTVEIKVEAEFKKLDCSATSAVLGGAGPNVVFTDEASFPDPNAWYVAALGRKLAGSMLDSTEADIFAQFTTALDDPGCGFPRKWYYGLDAKPVGTQIDLVTVVIHELAHGLGFITLVDGQTGTKFNGRDDAFMKLLFDTAKGGTWPSLTDADRKASAISLTGLLWSGAQVAAATGSYTGGIGSGGRPQMFAPNPYQRGSSVSHWDRALTPNETMEPIYTGPLHEAPLTEKLLFDIGWSAGSGEPYAWLLPSSAKAPGQGGAYYTTSLKIGNRGSKDASFTLKFLGNNGDGTGGPEKKLSLAANKAVTYDDVLGSVFGLTQDYGAIRITSTVDTLAVISETSTPYAEKPPGTFGQSVPAFTSAELVTSGVIRSILGIREDSAFRTNLILANGSSVEVRVQLLLQDVNGNFIGQKTITLPPLGMTQVEKVALELGASLGLRDGHLLLSTPTSGGSFAAYAAVIDNTTNDPRTLLPR